MSRVSAVLFCVKEEQEVEGEGEANEENRINGERQTMEEKTTKGEHKTRQNIGREKNNERKETK